MHVRPLLHAKTLVRISGIMNVTLIGMAGAGKSYLGKKLADALDLEWVDSDILLSEAYGGKDIQAILDDLGEEKYLQTEADICINATKGKDGMCISPGGSIVYVDRWMKHMCDISKVIYLKVPFEMVEERLLNVPPRAIIGLGRKSLRELYDERHPLYEKNAHLTVEPAGLSSDEFVRTVMDRMGVDKNTVSAIL